jgi:hypothetical protein
VNKKVIISKKSRRTPDELREASKHIYWDVRYLSQMLEFILRFRDQQNEGDIGGLLFSIHEAFLIHARKTIDFLYNSSDNIYDDDIIAEDYFRTSDTWKRLRPAQPDALRRAKENIGKLLTHFTYRVKEHPSGKVMRETSDIYVGVFMALQKFLSEVDGSLLDEQLDYLRMEKSKIVICYPLFLPEGKAPYQIRTIRDKAAGFEIRSVN